MKVHITTDNLKNRLSLLSHGISTKTPLPILTTILLEAREGSLMLRSTDLEIGIEIVCAAEVIEPGSIALPAKLFSELIQSLPEETLTLLTHELACDILSKKTKSTIQGITPEDFPKLYEQKGERIVSFSLQDLRKNFTSVIFAASQDTNRPALSGILMKPEEQGFLLVATDGYRLSLKHQILPSMQPVSAGVENMLIPSRVFREILGLKNEEESVTLSIAKGNNQVIFEQGETLIIGRLIDAVFPTYEKIIPSDFSVTTTCDREELLKAVRVCSIFARDSANIIKLSLKKDKVIVSSQTPSLGENSVDVEADLHGEENEIAFNAKYLLDVLANIQSDILTFEMTGPLNPGVFKVKDDPSYLHLIMPIRLQQ